MKIYIQERCRELAKYIIATGCTYKECAKKFGVSASTVKNDMRKNLPRVDHNLYLKVSKVIDLNKAEAHLRGGITTQERCRINKITI